MAVIATGFFDGVHLGHCNVLRTLVRTASERGEESLVLTFWPHPRAVLQNDAREFRLLTSLEEKTALLKGLGVSKVEVIPFTREFASMTAEQYLEDVVKKRYAGSAIVVGYDNRLGSDRLSREEIGAVAENLGLDVIPAGEYRPDGVDETISSTAVRRLLSEGNVEKAAEFLGRTYSLEGTVVTGNQLGRKIGFPTANIQLWEPLKLIPGNGVYLSKVRFGELNLWGMTNIGTRPTVSGESAPVTIETNIFKFNEEIYGLPLKISLVKRVREERKFDSIADLRRQLCEDRLTCGRCLQLF